MNEICRQISNPKMEDIFGRGYVGHDEAERAKAIRGGMKGQWVRESSVQLDAK